MFCILRFCKFSTLHTLSSVGNQCETSCSTSKVKETVTNHWRHELIKTMYSCRSLANCLCHLSDVPVQFPQNIGLYKKERPPVKQNKKYWLKICVFHTFCAISVQSDMLENRQNFRIDPSLGSILKFCLFSITELCRMHDSSQYAQAVLSHKPLWGPPRTMSQCSKTLLKRTIAENERSNYILFQF